MYRLNEKKIYIFGISEASNTIKEYLIEAGFNVMGYVDNDYEKVRLNNYIPQGVHQIEILNKYCMRYEVKAYKFSDVEFDKTNFFLILSKHYSDMAKQLQQCGYKEDQNFLLIGDFNEYIELDENYLTFSFDNKYSKVLFCRVLIDFLKEFETENFKCIQINDKWEALLTNGKIKAWVYMGYPWIFKEIFGKAQIYNNVIKYIKNNRYVVIDIGGNRGYAALYFASQPWCDSVEVFELMKENCEKISENITYNDFNIHLHSFGLGDQDEEVEAYYFADRDGISSRYKSFLTNYAPDMELDDNKVMVNVRKASMILSQLLETYPSDTKFIIKIDVEGAEYAIINDLITNAKELFCKIDIVIGEAHMGIKQLDDMLEKVSLYRTNDYENDQELDVCSFVYTKKENGE